MLAGIVPGSACMCLNRLKWLEIFGGLCKSKEPCEEGNTWEIAGIGNEKGCSLHAGVLGVFPKIHNIIVSCL